MGCEAGTRGDTGAMPVGAVSRAQLPVSVARAFRAVMQGRLRVLPPIGGWIPARAVIGAIAATVRGTAQHDALTAALREKTGLPHWGYAVSGRAALSAVLRALHEVHPDRTEVIIPAYTSYSVPAAVVHARLAIRLCDVEPLTLGIDPAGLARCMTSKTLCVLADHLYGLPSRIGAIVEIARARQIPVIEDAAQALGIVCGGRPGGTSGTVGLFSASRGKTLPGAGGGLIGTDDLHLAERCRRMLVEQVSRRTRDAIRVLQTIAMASCMRPRAYWLPAAMPFLKLGSSIFDPAFETGSMTVFQRALFHRLLPLEPVLRRCREHQALALTRELRGSDVQCLMPLAGDHGAYLRLPALARDAGMRERILIASRRAGLGVTGGYPLALSQLAPLRSWLAADDPCPVAESLSRRLVTFPTHPWVSNADRAHLADLVMRCA